MVGYIYRHWIVNDKGIVKSYIGKTRNNPQRRWGSDGKGYYCVNKEGKDSKFWSAIKKYGWNNFNHEIVEEVHSETVEELESLLSQREIYYIDLHGSYRNGYNSTIGGEGIVGVYREYTPEFSLKRRKYMKGTTMLPRTSDYKENMKKVKQGTGLGGDNSNAKQVLCLNTMECFDSCKEAGEWCGCTTISKACRCAQATAGRHPQTGEQLFWIRVVDFWHLMVGWKQ